MLESPKLMRGVALLLLALPLACSIATSPALSRQQLADRIARGDAPFVLDVRTEGEYQAGHIPGTELVPMNQVQAAAQTWNKRLNASGGSRGNCVDG